MESVSEALAAVSSAERVAETSRREAADAKATEQRIANAKLHKANQDQAEIVVQEEFFSDTVELTDVWVVHSSGTRGSSGTRDRFVFSW